MLSKTRFDKRGGKMRNRFEITYSQNSFGSTIEILVDREAGINYIWRRSCNAGGLTPLLGTDGQPVISQEGEYDEK